MATKKYLSLERLTEYDELIKGKIDSGDAATLASAKSYTDTVASGKSDTGHNHDDRYYTETEVDTKISAVNTSITNITSGTVVVKEAEHATSADNATTATTATTASNASTLGSTTADTGTTTKPIYLKNGVATAGSTYAGGTKVTLNGSGKGGSSASFYAPTGAGTSGYILKSNGSGAPTWLQTLPIANGGTGATTAAAARTNLEVYSTTEVDTALAGKSDASHNHDSAYDAKGSADTALASAKTYADNAAAIVKNDLLNGAGEAYDTLKELGDLISVNVDAIDALEAVAAGKADAEHTHAIADVTGLQSALDGKAAASHGTHVTYSTTAPVMDGTASVGTASTVARSDHRHPVDTSRASQVDLDALETVVAGKAAAEHDHTVSEITDLTATAAELNYMDGVTSNVQTQLDAKQATITGAATTITGSNLTASRALISNSSGKVAVSAVTSTELGYLDGVTSAIQTQLDGKQATITGGASTIASSNLTASRALISDASGKVAVSAVTSTELGYLDGVKSAIQTQIDTVSSNLSTHTNNSDIHFTAAERTKLAGIATGATKVTVDSALSSTSTNPVQNKAVNSAISTATSAISTNTNSINAHTTRIATLETKVGDGFEEITSAEIQALFTE